nr:patatin-like phospholipase family protein [Acinetobacter nematophilus]
MAISGGGDNGAFAAGVLGGLSASGQRPYFKVVTGISTGALIAPFAFLGTPYDDILQTVATSVGPDKIFQHRNIFMGLAKDGMANSKPLAKILKQYITPEILNLVAKEYRKGRVLQIGTTDLDSGRQVIWNMGEIASSNSPNALELFCKIIIASASIPGVVSPVMIDVEVNRKKYQEMHVDGGVVSQVFLYPATLMEELERVTGKHLSREVHMYVIRNGRLKSNWSETKKRTLSIGGRAINILIQSQGINDLLHLFQIAKQDNVDFNLAYIGEDFNVEHAQEFDRHYMQKLYEYGFNFAATHQQWHKSLPKEVLMR